MRGIGQSVLRAVLVACSLFGSTYVIAADAPADPPADSANPPGLEEVIVTARLRAENLQTTPVAVSAFSSAALESRSIGDALSLTQHVPNLNSTSGFSGGSYANYFIRGVGQADQVIGVDPGVALYIDGVYAARANGADIATLDLDRIEVLRGPQGTLFGKNTLGGAISVFTHKPTNQLEGQGKVLVGSRDLAEFRGWVNVPLVDSKLLARVSVDVKTRNGYSTSLSDGHRYGDVKTASMRGHLLYEASDTLNFDLAGDYLHTHGTTNMAKLAAIGNLGFFPPSYSQYLLPGNVYQTYGTYDPGNTLDVGGVSLTANWDGGPLIGVKSITAYRSLRQKGGTDFDGGPQSVVDESINTRQYQFSQELQLFGKLLGSRLNWLVGGYYFDERPDQAIPLFAFSPLALDQVTRLHITNQAAFGQATFSLTNWLNLTGGIRYTHERKVQTSSAYFFNNYDAFYTLSLDQAIETPPDQIGLVTQPATGYSKSWNSTTPKVSLEANVTADVLAYISWSKGFKSGGFNSRTVTKDFQSFDPEKLTTYEVGMKSEWLDRKVRLNVAGFYSDYRNVQLLVLELSPEGALNIATQNAAKSKIYGGELEAIVRPFNALQIDSAVGYLHNKYVTLSPGAIAAGVGIHDPLPEAPKWSVNLGAQYSVALHNDNTLTYRVDYSYKSRYTFFASDQPLGYQRPLSLTNMRLSYDQPNGLNVALFVNNVFGKYYYSLREDVRNSYDASIDWPAEPRSFGVEITQRF